MSEGGGDYRRGRVDATLDDHAAHLAKINGSIERFADEVNHLSTSTADALHALVLAVQRLADAADADRSTVKVTAQALEKAETARRDKSEQGWTPFQRGLAIIGGLAAIIGAIYLILTATSR